MSKRVLSPLLHVASFVGAAREGKPAPHAEDGKPWLWCERHGFSFCVSEINPTFGKLPFGEVVRMEAALEHLTGFEPFSLNDACRVSSLADRMLGELFEQEIGTTQWDVAVLEHFGFGDWDERDPDFPDMEDHVPGRIYYRVVRV